MIRVISRTYETYLGDNEPHILRLLISTLVSILVAAFGTSLSSTALPAMALTVSVLAGFTFTALFSGHLFSTNSLPDAETENDRHDLQSLLKLCGNLKIRSEFFLLASVVELVIIFVLSINTIDGIGDAVVSLGGPRQVAEYLRDIFAVFAYFWTFVGIFVFLEILYSFYRLAETALAIVEIRQRYLDSRIR